MEAQKMLICCIGENLPNVLAGLVADFCQWEYRCVGVIPLVNSSEFVSDIDYLPEDHVVVIDNHSSIEIYRLSDGERIRRFEGYNFRRLCGIQVINKNQFIVVESIHPKIKVFNTDGTLERQWGKKGLGQGEFVSPKQALYLPCGKVVIVDEFDYVVQILDSHRDGDYSQHLLERPKTVGWVGIQSGCLLMTDEYVGSMHVLDETFKIVNSWDTGLANAQHAGKYPFVTHNNQVGILFIENDSRKSRLCLYKSSGRLEMDIPVMCDNTHIPFCIAPLPHDGIALGFLGKIEILQPYMV